MTLLITAAVLIGMAASLYTAYSTYVARHSAATSARIARHAANEAGANRDVARNAARIAVAVSGTPDPGTPVDPERVTGVPEEPPAWKDTGKLANWHEEDPRRAVAHQEIHERVTEDPYRGMATRTWDQLYAKQPTTPEEVARHNEEVAGDASWTEPGSGNA